MTPLSPAEKKEYRQAKKALAKQKALLLRDLLIMGQWLGRVLLRRLYREQYGSFEEFCANELPFGARRAYQLADLWDQVKDRQELRNAFHSERHLRSFLGEEAPDHKPVLRLTVASDADEDGGDKKATQILDIATSDLSGDEKRRRIRDLINQAEEAARNRPAPPRSPRQGKGGPPADRRAGILAVEKKIDGLMAWCKEQHAGLVDVADVCDQRHLEAASSLGNYFEAVRSSAEEVRAA